MEARIHLKNGAGLKSHTSRRNLFLVATVMLLVIGASMPAHAQISIIPNNMKPPITPNLKPYYQYLLDFERDLRNMVIQNK